MNINLNCPIGTDTSYQILSVNILKALQKRGHNVAAFSIGQPNAYPEDVDSVKKALGAAQLYDPEAPSIRIWHQNQLAESVGKGLRIGMPIFELREFSDIEKHHLSSQDALFVASHWAHNIIRINGITVPTYVVPLGVDRNTYNENIKPLVPKSKKTVFLNVGKTERRKGHDVLIEAFNNAFGPSDNVELWICWHNPFMSPEDIIKWENLYLDSKMGKAGKVKILTPLVKAADPPYQVRIEHPRRMAAIMASADCIVQPSRAEGWNMPLLEGMSVGLHAIATDYSAHTEYCNSDNCNLIKFDGFEVADDGYWFRGNGSWFRFTERGMDELAMYMEHVHKVKQSGALGINRAGIKTSIKFSWMNTASAIEAALTDLGVK